METIRASACLGLRMETEVAVICEKENTSETSFEKNVFDRPLLENSIALPSAIVSLEMQ